LEPGEGDLEAHRITHRQRLEKCLTGEEPDQIPIALWRHFPVDDQAPDSLAAAVIGFQRRYDFDLVKVTPASSFCIKDWGSVDEWHGNSEGTREYIHRVIDSPDDWLKLPILDPYKGALGDQLSCLRMVCEELGPDVPVLQTIFSPLSQAKNLVGNQKLLVHMRKYPDAVEEGLNRIAESTQKFIETARKLDIAGIFYAVQHANYHFLSESEYAQFGRKYDLQLLETVSDKWLNMLHLHGEDIMYNQFTDYPVQVINWHDRDTYPDLEEGKRLFNGMVCGGLQRIRTMELGTPAQVYSEAKEAIRSTLKRRFILGTGCVLQVTTPDSNILAAIQSCRE
jgi:uroporphyrinogen decarboxylase